MDADKSDSSNSSSTPTSKSKGTNASSPPSINSWQTILAKVATNAGLPDATMLVLGDPGCGKSSLLSRFRHREHNQSSLKYVTEYSYVSVSNPDDEEDDQTSRLNIWQINDPSQLTLLSQILPRDNMDRLVILIALDLSQPWTVFKSLEKWFKAVCQLQEQLFDELDEEKKSELRESLTRHLQFYRDPAKEAEAQLMTDEQLEEVKLDQNLPSVNLGIPIVVAGCKSDSFRSNFLDSEVTDRFESMSFYLRKQCLEYGAALIYTSVSGKSFNIDTLQDYIVHRTHNFKFTISPQVHGSEVYDRIFLPSGFDSEEFIEKSSGAISHKRQKHGSIEEAITKLFPVPAAAKHRKEEKKVEADLDSTFYRTLKFDLDQKPSSAKRKAPKPVRTETPRRSGTSSGSGSHRASRKSSTADGARDRQRSKSRSRGGPKNQAAVKDFFQSLLHSSDSKGGRGSSSENVRKRAMRAAAQGAK